MMHFLQPGRSPIGLDIGPRAIAAAQLTRPKTGRGEWRLEAALHLDRPAGAAPTLSTDEARRVAQSLNRQGFTGSDVVLAVPEERLIAAALELPPRSSGAPLVQLAGTEVARAHRLEPGTFEMACWEVPGPARAAAGTHMMAVACRHADAEEITAGLENAQAGMRIAALDARSWAVARACQAALDAEESLAAVLDLTDSAALLTIVQHGMPVYERLLSDGALQLVRTSIRSRLDTDNDVADHIFSNLRLDKAAQAESDAHDAAAGLLIDHLEKLAGELRTAIAYAEHRFNADIKRILLQGGGAAIPGMPERLSELLHLDAQALTPASILAISPAIPSGICTPALLAAIGLAMHGSRPAAMAERRAAA